MKHNRREMQNMGYKKGLPVWIIIVVFLLFLGVLTFGLATLWQNQQQGTKNPQELETPVEEDSTLEDTLEVPLEAVLEDPLEDLEEINAVYRRRPEFGTAVLETKEAQGNEYFDDAVFFGDSISVGIAPYLEAILPDIAVIAQTGVSVHSASTNEVITVDAEKMTMLDAAMVRFGPRNKVYIMLGSNGLDMDKESFIQGYKEFVGKVKTQYPGAKIYLQSMTPVTGTEQQQIEYPSLNNEKITEYNLAIMQLAQEEEIYYVDVAAAFLNEEGILPEEASPDGVHFPGEYYYKWFDYLKKHTVE